MKKLTLCIICSLFFLNTAQAQILKNITDKVNRKVENKINQKIDKAVDNTVDGVMNPGSSKSKKKSSKKENGSVSENRNQNREAQSNSLPAQSQPQKNGLVFKIDDRFDGPNCKKAEISKLPGKWRENQMGSTMDVPQKYVTKEREVISKIRQMIMKNYQPTGLVVSNSDVTGLDRRHYDEQDAKNWPALPYSFSAFFLEFYCDNNTDKPVTDGSRQETTTRLAISANTMYPAFSLEPHIVNTSKSLLDPWVVTPYIEYEEDGYIRWDMDPLKVDPTLFEEMWIITNDGKKPYSFVTEKEYLERLKVILKDQLDQNEKTARTMNPIRSKAEQDADKKSSIERWRKSGESEGKINLWINEWKTDEEKLAAQLKKVNDSYDKNIRNIDNYLKNANAADLNRPASPLGNDAGSEFSGFGSGPGSVRVLKFNEGYYNRKLPLSATQFITVYIKNYEQDNPVYYQAIEEIRKAVDVKFLKSLLEK